ncbi:MAG: trigger factor, partial [Clostridia bacterium]|nr:trigger factor [Clostridia bacterium]
QRPDIVKQLKLRAVLVAVAKAENITVDENELEAEFQRIGEKYNITADRVREIMGDETLRRDLATGKSFNLIVNSAVIK